MGCSTLTLSNAMAAANLADDDRNCPFRNSAVPPSVQPRTPGTRVGEEPAEKQVTEEADRSHDTAMENLFGEV